MDDVEQIQAQPQTPTVEADDPAGLHSRLKAATQRWFVDRIQNSPVSQSTPAYNHLVSALPHLLDELVKEL